MVPDMLLSFLTTELTSIEANDLTLTERAFLALKSAIIHGHFAPGERLPELEIASALGVSRTPVREAIRMLHLQGLLNLQPNGGAKVRKYTIDELKEINYVRTHLESAAVMAACAQGVNAKSLKELTSLAAAIESKEVEEDPFAVLFLNMRFHIGVVALSGNSILEEVFESLMNKSLLFWSRAPLWQLWAVTSRGGDHWRILQALEKERGYDAVREVQRHCEAYSNRLARLSSKENELLGKDSRLGMLMHKGYPTPSASDRRTSQRGR